MRNYLPLALLVSLLASLLAGCSGCGPAGSESPPAEVVVYAALDREFSQPVLDDFTRQTGIRVLAKYDVESTKTVGLTAALMAEASRPRCDVFWNNEILNTLRLEQQGLLASYRSPAADCFPEMYRSPGGAWHGFAARARVLIVNTRLVSDGERPKSIYDLADPKWKGKIGIARPIAGTTASHVACLYAALGKEKTETWLRSLRANDVKILGGNKQVAQAAASGEIAFGLTDTDDALIEIERAQPVAIVYPDAGPADLGTLFIPNTICLIDSGPNPEAARKLIDFLLSPAVESKLALGASAQIPLNPAVETRPRGETPQTVQAMEVDFAEAARQWDAAAKFIRDEFLR